jgi:hypothetical protein
MIRDKTPGFPLGVPLVRPFHSGIQKNAASHNISITEAILSLLKIPYRSKL